MESSEERALRARRMRYDRPMSRDGEANGAELSIEEDSAPRSPKKPQEIGTIEILERNFVVRVEARFWSEILEVEIIAATHRIR
jgi:hypothetical protein